MIIIICLIFIVILSSIIFLKEEYDDLNERNDKLFYFVVEFVGKQTTDRRLIFRLGEETEELRKENLKLKKELKQIKKDLEKLNLKVGVNYNEKK